MELALRPASLPWLIEHEVRLSWRKITNGKPAALLTLGGMMLLAMHVIAYVLLDPWPAGVGQVLNLGVLGAVMLVSASLMLAQAVAASVTALFDRGDLDLLLSSPLPTQHVFVARGLGIAISLIPMQLCLIGPFANAALLLGHPQLLAIYPVLMAIALGMTAAGMGLTLGLVKLLGTRRARTVAQVMGSVIGALFFLVTQAQSLLSREQHARWSAQIDSWTAPGGPLAPESPVLFPVRAVLGDPLPLLLLVAVGLGCFMLMVRLTHRRFVLGVQEATSDGATRSTLRPGGLRFRGGVARNMVLKEWRLILRDPQLISKTLLQLLYLLPLAFIWLRGGNPLRLMAAVEFLAMTLTSALSWITVATEDAPDLLGCAPTSLRRLLWLKVLAAVAPVWLLLLPLPIYLAMDMPWLAALMAACLAGGMLNLAACQIWYPRKGRRSDLAKRAQGNAVVGITDLVLCVSWTALTFGLTVSSPYTALALAPIVFSSAVVWIYGRERRLEMGLS